MNISGLNSAFADSFRYADRTEKVSADGISFAKRLQTTQETKETSNIEAYRNYLEKKYGNVSIQNVGKDQTSMDKLGASTSGTGNVVIAPNILEQMAKDPEKAAFYEEKIRHYYDTLPMCKAQLSAMGHEIHSSGIVIHPDGTVTHYISGDLKPEERARIEAQIKAEAEEKAKRKREYQKRIEEAAQQFVHFSSVPALAIPLYAESLSMAGSLYISQNFCPKG